MANLSWPVLGDPMDELVMENDKIFNLERVKGLKDVHGNFKIALQLVFVSSIKLS